MTNDTAPSVEFIPVPQLPDPFTKEVNQVIRLHSVSMVVADENESEGAPCAGVLAILASLPGIITARHVTEELARRRTLVLMVGPRHVYRISSSLLTAYAPPSVEVGEPFDAQIPDIAFVPLSPKHKGEIEAKGKVFYSIDRREADPSYDPQADDGFWVVIGSPAALLRREARAVSSLTYITNIERKLDHDGWDYLFMNMNLDANPVMPRDLQGMSGGGIWRVRFRVNGDRTKFWIDDRSRDIALTGVTFLQTSDPGRQLIAHGPKSI